MRPKERVLAALDHRPTDRVPLDITHDELFPSLESALRAHFMVKDLEAVRLALGIDIRWVQPVSYRLPRHPELAGTNWFGTTLGLQSFADGLGLRPLHSAETVAEVERYPWPDPDWFDYSSVAVLANQYRDYGIVAPMTWSPLFGGIAELCGMERALVLLADRPALVDAMVEHILEFYLSYYRRILDAAPGQIDIMYTGDDPAGQTGMLFSPRMWRRYFKKPFARLFQLGKARGVRIMHHICGSAVDLIPELLEIGMDILMPLQFSAARMDPRELKARYGRDLSFYGGVDIQRILPFGTEAEVKAEVRRLIDVLGAGGGYILGPAHSLLDDVPPANVLAMYDEARCR